MKRIATVSLEFRLSDYDDEHDKYIFSRYRHFQRPVSMDMISYMKVIYGLEDVVMFAVGAVYGIENVATSCWMNTLENRGLNGSGEDELDSAR